MIISLPSILLTQYLFELGVITTSRICNDYKSTLTSSACHMLMLRFKENNKPWLLMANFLFYFRNISKQAQRWAAAETATCKLNKYFIQIFVVKITHSKHVTHMIVDPLCYSKGINCVLWFDVIYSVIFVSLPSLQQSFMLYD